MVNKRRMRWLLAGTVLGTSMIAIPAFAQDALNQQKMQNEINSLQQQLQALQDQVARSKTPQGVYYQAPPPGAPLVTKEPAWLPQGVQISLAGSFFALEGAWRQKNEVSSGASDPPFGNPGIPLQNSPLGHENEFAMSAQQSRIALKTTGDIDPVQHLKGYLETDFLGAGVTANNRESNSFNLRVRQLYGEYDNDDWHFHTAFGQTWSLATQDRVGMMPGAENTPLTIDAQYVAGFNWDRLPTIRLVGDWNKTVWYGISIEAPAGVTPGSGSGVSASPPTSVTTGLAANQFITNISNTCQASGLLNNTTTCTNDVAPDLVEKLAFDPGWGHYEVLGLQRWFADDVSPGTNAAGHVNWSQHATFGWGAGGSVLLPVVPKYLDLQGSVLTGQGIGRYGSSQLPDFVVGPNGTLQTIQATQFLVGAVGHPFAGNDIYAYYGQEQDNAKFWTVNGTQGGWGNPAYANSTCAIEGTTAAVAAGNVPFNVTQATCAFNVQKVQEFTIGFWQDAYKGDLGRVRVGLQYEYVRLTAFAGAGGPTTATSQPNQGLNPNNNIVFFSLRYYPFN
jgi:hypothetical protein